MGIAMVSWSVVKIESRVLSRPTYDEMDLQLVILISNWPGRLLNFIHTCLNQVKYNVSRWYICRWHIWCIYVVYVHEGDTFLYMTCVCGINVMSLARSTLDSLIFDEDHFLSQATNTNHNFVTLNRMYYKLKTSKQEFKITIVSRIRNLSACFVPNSGPGNCSLTTISHQAKSSRIIGYSPAVKLRTIR